MLEIGLLVVLLIVLTLPFSVKKVEHNLEVFLFIMGVLAVTTSRLFSEHLEPEHLSELIHEIISEPEPVMIAIAVLIAGFIFKYTRKYIHTGISKILNVIPLTLFIFLMIFMLGMVSSIITAIIAALILVEVVSVLNLDKKHEINLTIIACFSIGFGAALTPIGEPLSTILVTKLKGAPHFADFFYILKIGGKYIIPGVIVFSLLGMYAMKKAAITRESLSTDLGKEHNKDVVIRAFKIYLFVIALILLGTGFKPVIDKYIIHLDSRILYWINMSSAVLDNATLTAAEISPKMTTLQIQSALMALLISGGMLIPGNIPNIISANKLKIGSKAWARVGIPIGLIFMVIYFVIIYFLKF